MKCLGRDRCEVRLGSWRSSDASLSMKCLGRDRCEVRLGSWRSSDASRSMKCLGRDRCEVHLGLHLAWVIFSCFVSLRESYPTHPAEAASTCLVCRECQPCCASQNWKHPLRTFPVHWLQPKVCSSLSVFCMSWGTNQSKCCFLLVNSTDEMSLNSSGTIKFAREIQTAE